MQEHSLSRSFCYKLKAKLEELTIIKWDDYWQEYKLNMERYKRDLKSLGRFKEQVKEWQRF